MDLDTFKRIQKQVNDLEKTGVKFDVAILNDRNWEKGANVAEFEPQYYEVNKLSQLSQLQLILGKPIRITQHHNSYSQHSAKIDLGDLKITECTKDLSGVITSEKEFQVQRKSFASLRYFSPNLANLTSFRPVVISETPAEKTEEDVTYRFIGSPTTCEMCIPHTHSLYNYLDKGFFYAKVNRRGEKDKLVVTNEMTPDTYLVMLLCYHNPAFVKQLDNECYLPAAKAKLFRIKFEKDIKPEHRGNYDRVREILLADYEKSVNSNMIVKVVKGELPTATYNRIKLTKDTANYEGITLEAPGMLTFVNEHMIFDDRTDIYTIIQAYIDASLAELASAVLPPIPEGETEASITKEFKINGIEIKVKRTTANTRRTVNGHNINIEELNEVCYRASCFDTQEIFDKFVTSVTSMSLKWHDAIGNGIGAKIHDGLTDLEYKSHNAPSTAPRIRFLKEKDAIYLITGEGKEDRAPVKLNVAIRKIAMLNRQTNNKYSSDTGYSPRNAAWARRQLVKILKSACTFDVKEVIKDEAGEPILDAEGKKQYRVNQVCHLTDEKASFIGKMAQEYYEKAIKKSSVFLAEAVKTTGAYPITFNGEECWAVDGQMHKYAVSKKTNQVFNRERGNYICIVEPGHRVEVGFDATACRLLALKNDSVRVNAIGTLRHG